MMTPLMMMLAGCFAAAQAVPAAERLPDDDRIAPAATTEPSDAAPQIEAVPQADNWADGWAGSALVGLSDQDVLAAAAASIGAIDTMQARFVQTAASGAASAGTLYLDRPGRLRLDYDAPNPQEVVATGGLVYVHDSELETTDSYPVSKTPLRFLLAKRVDAADAVLTGVRWTDDEVSLTLRSADEDLEGEVAMVFARDGDDLALARWALFDPRGGVTQVALSEVERGVKLSRKLFQAPDAGGTFIERR